MASQLNDINLIAPTHNESNYLTVRDAIGKLPPLADGECDRNDVIHCTAKMAEINLKRIRSSIPGGTWKDWSDDLQLSCHKKKTGRSYGAVYGRKLLPVFFL